MKNLLLGTAAIAGLVLASAPAAAQMELTIGGHSKNYVGYLNQDDVAGTDTNTVDMIRETELHFNGESTLDSGLTFGFQVETEVDGGDTDIEESYVYMASSFGRVNLGSENGAAYLLQVAAPSADSNIDGIRQYINPVNYTNLSLASANTGVAGGTPAASGDIDGFDYDNDITGFAEKITYLSPNYSGFQVGVSYTFDGTDDGSDTGLAGFNTEDNAGNFDQAYEVAARYEGVASNLGYALGAGYTHLDDDSGVAGADDANEWNVGVDVDAGPFGIGAVYTEFDNGAATANESDTIVVGVDYTTGGVKLGASYFTQDDETVAGTLDTDRYTVGAIYTAGPGLSFRGSVSQIDHEVGAADADATSVMGGVQINF